MKKSIEVTGKNVEQAIQNGLLELKVPREDVDIRIIDAGGFLRKAKVQITLDREAEEKYEEREERLKKLEVSEEKVEEEATIEAVSEITEEKSCEEIPVKRNREPLNHGSEEEEKAGMAAGEQFLQGLMGVLQIEGSVKSEREEDNLKFGVDGEQLSELIGYRGEGLNALQFVMGVIVNRANSKAGRVFLNIGDYREKREQSLIKLANRMAVKVAKSKGRIKLEPMNAYERRIIHSALQHDSFVDTYSKGEDPYRYIIIECKKETK